MDLYGSTNEGLYAEPNYMRLAFAGALADISNMFGGQPVQNLAVSMPHSARQNHQRVMMQKQALERQGRMDELTRRNIESQIAARGVTAQNSTRPKPVGTPEIVQTSPGQYAWSVLEHDGLGGYSSNLYPIDSPNGGPAPQITDAAGRTEDEIVSFATRQAALKLAQEKSGAAFDKMETLQGNIRNYNSVIEAIDKGADTGAIMGRLPSFRAASIELDNLRKRLGLDVVGLTTFGQLSKGELDLALDVALPDKLDEAELRDWVVRKRDAQMKLYNVLEEMTIDLGSGQYTISEWITNKKEQAKQDADLRTKYGLD